MVCNFISLELTGVYVAETVAETVEVRRETECIQGTVFLMFSMNASVFCMDISLAWNTWLFYWLESNSKVNRTQTHPIL